MKAATRMDSVDQPGAHLRLVSDRPDGRSPGIKLSGVSKLIDRGTATRRRCGRWIFTSTKASSLSWSARPAAVSPRC